MGVHTLSPCFNLIINHTDTDCVDLVRAAPAPNLITLFGVRKFCENKVLGDRDDYLF